jgi:NAD(P)-dependent dehydrogenase (short-subunit alcohol dehydrogenase family)
MSDHRDLAGVYAPVTSATSGIRRATAEALVRHGGEVIVDGRNAGTRRGR